jgi:hypothetical protein
MIFSGRTYRPIEPSDYPKALLGQLVLFYYQDMEKYQGPAKLVGTKFGSRGEGAGFVISCNDGKELFVGSNAAIYVDVTPEKRYAVWHQPTQRFKNASYNDGGVKIYLSRQDAEIELEEWFRKNGIVNAKKNWYIVEWEIKQDAE